MIARVDHTVGGGGEIQRRRIVHRIHVDRFPTDLRTQRINERLPGEAEPGGSNVPRANTTSTSEQGAADADGVPIAGLKSGEVSITAAPNKRLIILISTHRLI